MKEDWIFTRLSSEKPSTFGSNTFGPNAFGLTFLSAPYIRKKQTILSNGSQNRFTCLLCDTIDLDYNEMSSHCDLPQHQENVQEIKTLQNTIQTELTERWNLISVDNVKLRSESLGLPRWQWEISHLLFQYIGIRSEGDIRSSEDCYDYAIAILHKYEFMEVLSLLELALWKAICLINSPEPRMSYLEFVEWQREGWKTNKTKMRKSNSIAIVIEHVIPFLKEGPSDNEEAY